MRSLPAVLFLCMCVSAAPCPGDEVADVLEAYHAVAFDAPDGELAKLDFYRRWSAELFSAATDHPDSPDAVLALKRAVSLSNGAGDYEVSIEICRFLTKLIPRSPRAWTELGSVIATYAESAPGSTSTELREEGVTCLQTANELILEAESDKTESSYFLQQYVINSFVTGTLADSLGRPTLAADSYADARRLATERSLPVTGRLRGHTPETLAYYELHSCIDSQSDLRAEQVLEYLVMNCSQQSPAFYIEDFAGRMHGKDSGEYTRLLAAWCETTSVSAELLTRLGLTYSRRREWDKALEVFIRVDHDYGEELIAADSQEISRGVSGRYGQLLILTAKTYAALRTYSAEELGVWTRFLDMHPDDGMAEFAVKRIKELQAEIAAGSRAGALTNRVTDDRISVWTLLAVNCVFAALVTIAYAVRHFRNKALVE